MWLGAVTSSPAMLQVIAAVERRPVPGIKVMGQPGSLWNVDYADSLSPAPNWTRSVPSAWVARRQYYFDLTQPLPAPAVLPGVADHDPAVLPILDLHMVPAITLTGTVGSSVRVDIHQPVWPDRRLGHAGHGDADQHVAALL